MSKDDYVCPSIYANPFIGDRIMNIEKWEVRRNVHSVSLMSVTLNSCFVARAFGKLYNNSLFY